MPRAKPTAMPNFIPAPKELVERFEKALQSFPEATPRKMFGYPAAFVDGQLFAEFFGDSMMIRLSADDRALFAQKGVKRFEPMPGRVMRE